MTLNSLCWEEAEGRQAEGSCVRLMPNEPPLVMAVAPSYSSHPAKAPDILILRGTFSTVPSEFLTHRFMSKINDYCFKPQNVEVICFAAIDK